MSSETISCQDPSPLSPPVIRAVIDIGATSVRMAVAEIYPDKTWVIKDRLQQSLSLGRDTFTGGKIKFSTIETCVEVLRRFQKSLQENWAVTSTKAIRAVATSAVREAENREQFINRVKIATGIKVDIIDGAEVNRLTFLAVRPLIEKDKHLAKDYLLLLEVGGGNTEVMGLRDGQVDFAQTHRFGSFRVRETLEQYQEPGIQLEEVITQALSGTVRSIRECLIPGTPVRVLALGAEARFAAERLCRNWDGVSAAKLAVPRVAELAAKVLASPVEELVSRHHIALPEAETLGPTLLALVHLAGQLNLSTLYVGNQNLRGGLLAEFVGEEVWSDIFISHIIHSAKEVGRKYHYDKKHSKCVTAYVTQLFDALRQAHQLSQKDRTILEVAAILHDIGTFVSNRSHHKHSKYLMINSEIFGLNDTDLSMAGLIARYHRGADPKPTHSDYTRLPAKSRLVLIQLAAMLRLVEALDSSHEQRLGDLAFSLDAKTLVITTRYRGSLSSERATLETKGKMFTTVFGLFPSLRPAPK
ncbi:MAG: HD domain-containing protein [Lentisphaeria bacterium]|nr:HD domain-containing protein [Lentisphaeria bacterium]